MQEWTNAITDAFAFGWVLSAVFLMLVTTLTENVKNQQLVSNILLLAVILWLLIASIALIM